MKWLSSSHCSWIAHFGDLVGNKKAADITADDALAGGAIMLSIFYAALNFRVKLRTVWT